MADTVPAQAPAATGTSTGPTTTTAAATAASATGATTSTQPNNPTIGNANTSTTATDPNSENRGLPYYEKLRRDLRDALQKKRLMDKSMVASPLLPSYILSSR
jgi:chromatin modification-related protein EAF6